MNESKKLIEQLFNNLKKYIKQEKFNIPVEIDDLDIDTMIRFIRLRFKNKTLDEIEQEMMIFIPNDVQLTNKHREKIKRFITAMIDLV